MSTPAGWDLRAELHIVQVPQHVGQCPRHNSKGEEDVAHFLFDCEGLRELRERQLLSVVNHCACPSKGGHGNDRCRDFYEQQDTAGKLVLLLGGSVEGKFLDREASRAAATYVNDAWD
ncbi:MAG: hypothetical protein ACK56F_00610, partial [bacterium]